MMNEERKQVLNQIEHTVSFRLAFLQSVQDRVVGIPLSLEYRRGQMSAYEEVLKDVAHLREEKALGIVRGKLKTLKTKKAV